MRVGLVSCWNVPCARCLVKPLTNDDHDAKQKGDMLQTPLRTLKHSNLTDQVPSGLPRLHLPFAGTLAAFVPNDAFGAHVPRVIIR